MNKSSATKKSTFLLIVLLLSSLFSFSCGSGDGNSEGGGNPPATPDTNEARLMKALAGLSFVNEANAKCTLDFTADGKVIVNKRALYSDPKVFAQEFWKYEKVTVDDLLDRDNEQQLYFLIRLEEKDEWGDNKIERIDVDDKNDITLLEDYYYYDKPEYSGIKDRALYDLTAEENLEFDDVDVSDDGKTYSGRMTLPGFDFYFPPLYCKINCKGTEYVSSLNVAQLECFSIAECHYYFEFNTETKQLYVDTRSRDDLNESLEKWSGGNNSYSFGPKGYGYPCEFVRAEFEYHTFDIKDGSPAYYRLASSPGHFGGSDDPSGSAITLSGEYSVTGVSNITWTFANGILKRNTGSSSALSYTYEISNNKLKVTQSTGGYDTTYDFTLSENGGNIVVSGEQLYVYMIFDVNASSVTLAKN